MLNAGRGRDLPRAEDLSPVVDASRSEAFVHSASRADPATTRSQQFDVSGHGTRDRLARQARMARSLLPARDQRGFAGAGA